MRNRMVFYGTMGALALAAAAFAQKTNNENEIRDRGQTPVLGHSPDRGVTLTLHGIVVDAACRDRSAQNLRRPPEGFPTPPAQAKTADSAHGITIDPRVAEKERADALAHQVPDMRDRSSDETCGITGQTSSFGMLLDDGKFLILDSGGNTLMQDAIQSSAAGHAMLDGNGPALKPKATVQGTILRDRLKVAEVVKLD